ncbi:MAG: hypothetical protein ACKPKO_64870, partial [Candidatus Fonsibacter sp.]
MMQKAQVRMNSPPFLDILGIHPDVFHAPPQFNCGASVGRAHRIGHNWATIIIKIDLLDGRCHFFNGICATTVALA